MAIRTIAKLLSIVVAACTILGSANAGGDAPVSLKVTGIVQDHETKKPLEGAYVLAAYHESVVGEGAMTSWCIRTRGMTTGPDGAFHFPVEKLDGLSPAVLVAIKPGYYLYSVHYPDRKVFKKQDAAAYANRLIDLSKQVANRPESVLGTSEAFCNRARTTADAAASIGYLKIDLAERSRLGFPAQDLEAIKGMIGALERIDAKKGAP